MDKTIMIYERKKFCEGYFLNGNYYIKLFLLVFKSTYIIPECIPLVYL